MNIRGILLAAGAGSRFGGDKLVHPLADGTPIGVAAARNLLSVLPEVVAVVRPADTKLAALLEGAGCRVTVCAQAVRGMGASLAHAIGLARDADAWVVALADMPAIQGASISAIVRALETGAQLVAPSYRGERGHPVGFGKSHLAALLQLDGDAGARAIIQAHRGELVLVECADPGVLQDIDRPGDLVQA